MNAAARILALAACAASISGCKRSSGSELERQPTGAQANPTTSQKPPDIDLVVLVVIDQWPSWSFKRDLDMLAGGLVRLVSEGVYYADAEYPYASTFTAPGHATIGSGAPPSKTGILANGWYRRDRGKYAPSTSDLDYPVFNIAAIAAGKPGAVVAGSGASSTSLLVEGVADELRREKPDARVVSVGLKERAAVLMTGRKPHLPIWYDDAQVAMTTGRYWTDAPPDWLVELSRAHPIKKRFTARWTVSDPEFLAKFAGPDDQEGEAEVWGFDRRFPHDLSASENKPKAMRVTPEGTSLVFETARAALAGERLGKRGATDLLAITVSSHDYAGHLWGQRSWERFDTLRHIDRELGSFLEHLDATLGADRYAVVVTSDHGAVPLIERSRAAGREARRIPYFELVSTADRALGSVLGKGNWVIGYSANSLYLSDELLARADDERRKAIDAAAGALARLPQIGLAAPRTAVAGGDCSRHEDATRKLVCMSAHPERSGEILLVPSRYSLFIEARFPTGSAHGTPSDEDRFVPLIVRRPGVAPRRPGERPSMLSVAPTIAALLGIDAPPAATAPPVAVE